MARTSRRGRAQCLAVVAYSDVRAGSSHDNRLPASNGDPSGAHDASPRGMVVQVRELDHDGRRSRGVGGRAPKHHAYQISDPADKSAIRTVPGWKGSGTSSWATSGTYLAELRKHPDTLTTFARDVLNRRGWWDRHVFRRGWLGLLVGTSILWVVLGAESLLSHKPFSAACWDGLCSAPWRPACTR